MSSNLFVLENSFFSDPFPTFTDPHSFQILQEIQENINNNNLFQECNNHQPTAETSSLDQIATAFLSSPSPPGAELENLSLSHPLEKTEYSVKTEECQLNFRSFAGFGGAYESAARFMQRSCSSNSFDNENDLLFQAQFDSVLESQDLDIQILSSTDNMFPEMRRVCSAGELQNVKTNIQTRNVLCSSPLSTEKSFVQEPNFKVGRYSAEERKERIDRYRAKRTQRNFNKTIKYACRKTLADNRPRVRGRFARNDEAGEIPKASMSYGYEEEEDYLWIDRLHQEDVDGVERRRKFFNISGSTQYQNYSY